MRAAAYSLQNRLAWLVLGLLTAVWIGTAAITWFDARHEVEEILDSHLAQAAALVMAHHGEPGGEHPIDLPALHRYAYKTAIQVFRDGQLVLRSASAPTTPLAGAGAGGVSGFATVRIDEQAWRVFATHDAQGQVQVFVGEEEKSRNAILLAVLRSTLWPLVAALPLLVLAVWWAVRRGLRPMRQLGRSLVERRPEALDRVRIDDAPAEMAPMIDALNALFGRIEALLDTERRFTADAAHELRTPIAAIRAHAQVALHEADGAARRHALQSTLDGCDRATRLVEQLLTLSRLEVDAMPKEERVDLGAVTRRVLADLAPRPLARRQTLALVEAGPCMVRGDETLLAVLVRNLVDNAIRYSPPSARIEVRVDGDPSGVRWCVEDSGPGLSQADLQRLGERFFRALGTVESGSGLGLSIVRRIAKVHRMTLTIERSASLGGLAVHVHAPPPAGDGSPRMPSG